MAGIMLMSGADVRVSGIGFSIVGDEVEVKPATFTLRTDLWPHWLTDAIDAAAAAHTHSAGIAAALQLGDEPGLKRLVNAELRASLRAVTGAAFALDSVYAAVKTRSPEQHPDAQRWRTNRTSRSTQIYETLRFHLKLRDPGAAEMHTLIKDVFKFRDWAVHPSSQFKEPVFRPDLDAGIDWHYSAFRSDNATTIARAAVQVVDALVDTFDRGSVELREFQSGARRYMDEVNVYYAATGLPPIATLPR